MENLLFLGVPILKHIRVHLLSFLSQAWHNIGIQFSVFSCIPFVNICDRPSIDCTVQVCFSLPVTVAIVKLYIIDTWSFPGTTEPSGEFLCRVVVSVNFCQVFMFFFALFCDNAHKVRHNTP